MQSDYAKIYDILASFSDNVTSTVTADLGAVDYPISKGSVRVAGVVSAIKTTATDETYVLSVQVSANGGSYSEVSSKTITEVGNFNLFLDTNQIRENRGEDFDSIKAVLTLAGTSPSLSHTIFLVYP